MERKLTILVAEDSEDDVVLLNHAFKSLNLENPVQFCRDGEETIDYLRGTGRFCDRGMFPFPSVIFVDLKMPRKGGFEILRWLDEHLDCWIIPKIVLTASGAESDIREAYRLGANSYFVKPGSLEALRQMLKVVYDYWRLCAKPSLPQNC